MEVVLRGEHQWEYLPDSSRGPFLGSGKYVEQLPDELKFMPGLGLVSADILVVEIDNP